MGSLTWGISYALSGCIALLIIAAALVTKFSLLEALVTVLLRRVLKIPTFRHSGQRQPKQSVVRDKRGVMGATQTLCILGQLLATPSQRLQPRSSWCLPSLSHTASNSCHVKRSLESPTVLQAFLSKTCMWRKQPCRGTASRHLICWTCLWMR